MEHKPKYRVQVFADECRVWVRSYSLEVSEQLRDLHSGKAREIAVKAGERCMILEPKISAANTLFVKTGTDTIVRDYTVPGKYLAGEIQPVVEFLLVSGSRVLVGLS